MKTVMEKVKQFFMEKLNLNIGICQTQYHCCVLLSFHDCDAEKKIGLLSIEKFCSDKKGSIALLMKQVTQVVLNQMLKTEICEV